MENYLQLLGSLKALQDNDVKLDYENIAKELFKMCRTGVCDDRRSSAQYPEETHTKARQMLRKYRNMCLDLGLIKIGQLWSLKDCEFELK